MSDTVGRADTVGFGRCEGILMADTGEATNVVTVATASWTRESTAQRHQTRSAVLWMVGCARRAAQNGRVDDARWWRDRAMSALWNMN